MLHQNGALCLVREDEVIVGGNAFVLLHVRGVEVFGGEVVNDFLSERIAANVGDERGGETETLRAHGSVRAVADTWYDVERFVWDFVTPVHGNRTIFIVNVAVHTCVLECNECVGDGVAERDEVVCRHTAIVSWVLIATIRTLERYGMHNFFTKQVSQTYDQNNKHLAPIGDAMHFLIRLILKDLPTHSRILCVGVGTGAEILSLAQEYPEWSFVGVDPSADMLEVCRERLEAAGLLSRCELIHGYVQDIPPKEKYDAVLSILVGHFVPKEDRLSFYRDMNERLVSGGLLVNTEISFDLDSKEYPEMLRNWEHVQLLSGGNSESIKTLPDQLKNILTVLPPTKVEEMIQSSNFVLPIRFFQAFMIMGWYAKKESK